LTALYAISDLHLAYESNRQALLALPAYPDDWLIVAGDVGESEAQLTFALRVLTQRFARVLWTPGNHELWTLPGETLRGEAKYQRLVALCQSFGVATPEDPYLHWNGNGVNCLLAPLLVLYDYSFRPAHIPLEKALAWAEEAETVCADELLLHPDPYPTRGDWCAARVAYSEQRLQAASATGVQLLLINHFPLRQELAYLPRIPRFSLWCGTSQTEQWHTRFPVIAVVYGHLHIRNSQQRDGVRFEEVSLGYPQQWQATRGMAGYLRKIW
jgi:3',5'-cyclic AMP phosphodiesterase CpdA